MGPNPPQRWLDQRNERDVAVARVRCCLGQVSPGVDSSQGTVPGLRCRRTDSSVDAEKFFVDVEQHVLGVPELDIGIGPDPVTETVDHMKPTSLEASRPVFRPLFVDVADASLVGNGSGKEHGGCQTSEALHQLVARRSGQMLTDLKRHSQVEPLADREGLREIMTDELVGIHEQHPGGHLTPVDTDDLRGAMAFELCKPSPDPTPDVDHTARMEQFDDQRNHDLR